MEYPLHAGLPMPSQGAVVGEVASLIRQERRSEAVVDGLQLRRNHTELVDRQVVWEVIAADERELDDVAHLGCQGWVLPDRRSHRRARRTPFSPIRRL